MRFRYPSASMSCLSSLVSLIRTNAAPRVPEAIVLRVQSPTGELLWIDTARFASQPGQRPMRRPAAFSANAGFTLVEALLAVLLMSVIVAALAVVTPQWMPSWDKALHDCGEFDALAVALGTG